MHAIPMLCFGFAMHTVTVTNWNPRHSPVPPGAWYQLVSLCQGSLKTRYLRRCTWFWSSYSLQEEMGCRITLSVVFTCTTVPHWCMQVSVCVFFWDSWFLQWSFHPLPSPTLCLPPTSLSLPPSLSPSLSPSPSPPPPPSPRWFSGWPVCNHTKELSLSFGPKLHPRRVRQQFPERQPAEQSKAPSALLHVFIFPSHCAYCTCVMVHVQGSS